MSIIGIDLGTSNSAAAVLRGGHPVIIPSSEGISIGGKAFPSYVAVAADGQMFVGELARRQAITNPTGTTTAFKRLMGQRVMVRLRDREFSPEQLSGFLLQKIKRDAEAFLGENVSKAVVTVPAYFDDNQRSATKDACRLAGLEVLRLVNEPTAASLSFGLDKQNQESRIIVLDLGGGTLDVTILEFGKGVFEVIATSGDTKLGGTDMDRLLTDFIVEDFRQKTSFDLQSDRSAMARVREAAEQAKIELSSNTSTKLTLPFLVMQNAKPLHLDMELSRSQLERLIQPVIERCKAPIQQALQDAHLTTKNLGHLVLVGGPTRMPIIRSFFQEIIGLRAETGVDPMECVAAGAAIQAGVLAGDVTGIVLVDVTPLSLGVETLGGIATTLIPRNSPIPIKKSELFTTAADLQTSVTIHVFQGERPMANDNTSLGTFSLDGLPPAPRGLPKIDVTFDIDANGILNVAAQDSATGKQQSLRITGSTRLPESEKVRMIREADAYAEQDKKKRDDTEKLNLADNTCYQAERLLTESGPKLTEDLRHRLDVGIKELKEAISQRRPEIATEKAELLKKNLTEVGTFLYSQTQAKPTAPPPPSEPSSGPRVVDAEYTKANL